eukprot:557176-Pelagomonas_calceolata.AAC.14
MALAQRTQSTEQDWLACLLHPNRDTHTYIATDSASFLSQIYRHVLNPMSIRIRLHAELIQAISTIIEHSPHQLNLYKVKAHSSAIGNEEADACAQTAAIMDDTDISLPDSKDPFHNSIRLSVKPPRGHSHTPLPQ